MKRMRAAPPPDSDLPEAGTQAVTLRRFFRPLHAVTVEPGTISAYVELAKVRILLGVVAACAIGFEIAHSGASGYRLIWALFGTGLLSAGGAALNQYLERDVDARMERTRTRPIPRGAMPPANALVFGVCLVIAGSAVLYGGVNAVTSALGFAGILLYVLVYTPLKRVTWLCTTVGAVPGAIPALMGWTAATGHLDSGGWFPFLLLFVWQHVHFYAIAWRLRSDYHRAGLKMLSVVDESGRWLFRLTTGFSVLLLPVSLLPVLSGRAGLVYGTGVSIAGIILFGTAVALTARGTGAAARQVLLWSVFYVPAVLLFVLLDRGLLLH